MSEKITKFPYSKAANNPPHNDNVLTTYTNDF